MTRWLVAIALVAPVACSTPKPQPPPRAPITLCAKVADHVVSLMTGAQNYPPEATDPFRRVVGERCDRDNWSPEAQQCLLEITALDQGQRCQAMMTQPQVDAFVLATQAALGNLMPQIQQTPPDAQ